MLAIARALISEDTLLLSGSTPAWARASDYSGHLQYHPCSSPNGTHGPARRAMANQALGVADRAYVLETGSVTLQGKGSDLVKNPKVRAAYLGTH